MWRSRNGFEPVGVDGSTLLGASASPSVEPGALVTDPVDLLTGWLPGTPGVDGYFPVVSLATVDADGGPDARAVLLSEISGGLLYFHTDSRSRKVRQLREEPRVALVIPLPDAARQVVVRGAAHAAGTTELTDAYRRRSRYLQSLAWVNSPEVAQLTAAERTAAWSEFDAGQGDAPLDAPVTWCGFAVHPSRMTFWQGGTDTPSHRQEFTRTARGWTLTDLPG
jgi:pyridoxamine 5'-phosphate oxidase